MLTDFFAFVVPGGDKDCAGYDIARTQLKCAHAAGIERLVAVSGFDPRLETYAAYHRRTAPGASFISRRDFKYAPQILLTGAVTTVTETLARLEELEALCVTGTRMLLLVMPEGPWRPELLQTPIKIRDERGLTPVIIRAELRGALSQFAPLGIPCAVSASCFLSIFGKRKMLDQAQQGLVSAMGSEMRGLRYDYSEFKKAAEALGGTFDMISEKTDRLLSGV